MAFHEVLFPIDISQGAKSMPTFSTIVVETDGGAETPVQLWLRPRYRFEISHELKRLDSAAALTAFFFARAGKANGFRFQDLNDFSSDIAGQAPGLKHATVVIDGNHFQLQKLYTNQGYSTARKISKPVAGSVTLFDNTGAAMTGFGTTPGVTVDTTTGICTVSGTPLTYVPTATFQFHVPVRFDTDMQEMLLNNPASRSWVNISLMEIRL